MSDNAVSQITAWVNGELVNPTQAALSAVDHGVTVGDGAFETAKIDGGAAFAMSRHLARMDRTLAGLGLPPVDHDRVRAGVDDVLAAAGEIDFGRLRWTVTGGYGPLGSDRFDSEPTYIITAAPSPRPSLDGGAIVTCPWVRNERAATAGLKTTSYAENVVALAHAAQHDAVESIFANTRGELCEGTASNIFLGIDGVLHTPPLDSGCLAGITRALVIEWCRAAGMTVLEQTLGMDALERADEAFVTSSIKDVFAVTAIDGRDLGARGALTEQAAEIFARASAADLDP